MASQKLVIIMNITVGFIQQRTRFWDQVNLELFIPAFSTGRQSRWKHSSGPLRLTILRRSSWNLRLWVTWETTQTLSSLWELTFPKCKTVNDLCYFCLLLSCLMSCQVMAKMRLTSFTCTGKVTVVTELSPYGDLQKYLWKVASTGLGFQPGYIFCRALWFM